MKRLLPLAAAGALVATAASAEPTLQSLQDRMVLAYIPTQIEQAVDRKDWDRARSYFADEVRVDFTSMAGGGRAFDDSGGRPDRRLVRQPEGKKAEPAYPRHADHHGPGRHGDGGFQRLCLEPAARCTGRVGRPLGGLGHLYPRFHPDGQRLEGDGLCLRDDPRARVGLGQDDARVLATAMVPRPYPDTTD